MNLGTKKKKKAMEQAYSSVCAYTVHHINSA